MIRRRSWVRRGNRGIQAEKKVAEILGRLPPEDFLVLNDVTARYGNVDHLVIRRDGKIFMIETKAHLGTVTFDGDQLLNNGRPFRRNPVCQMARNIEWFRSRMGNANKATTWITAVLVFPFGDTQVRYPVKRINVCGPRRMLRILRLTRPTNALE